MEFSRPEYWSGQPFPSPGDLPNPVIQPESPALQADSLPAEPRGKPRNTGVGSLSLLQRIFLTQESNWGLLHCRQILYQLSYQGIGIVSIFFFPPVLFGEQDCLAGPQSVTPCHVFIAESTGGGSLLHFKEGCSLSLFYL